MLFFLQKHTLLSQNLGLNPIVVVPILPIHEFFHFFEGTRPDQRGNFSAFTGSQTDPTTYFLSLTNHALFSSCPQRSVQIVATSYRFISLLSRRCESVGSEYRGSFSDHRGHAQWRFSSAMEYATARGCKHKDRIFTRGNKKTDSAA